MMLKKIQNCVKEQRFMRSLGEKGQGIVEYALILAFVVLIAAALVNGGELTTAVTNVFSNVTEKVNGNGGNGGGGEGGN